MSSSIDHDNDYHQVEGMSGGNNQNSIYTDSNQQLLKLSNEQCSPRKKGRLLTSKSNGNMLSSIGPELDHTNYAK